MIDLFHRFDVDKNGGLDRAELRTCFQVLGVPLSSEEFEVQ
jgi:Ca2+-binding EF-hand superfamily protein